MMMYAPKLEKEYEKRGECSSCGGEKERAYQGCGAPEDCRECNGTGKYSEYKKEMSLRDERQADFMKSIKQGAKEDKKMKNSLSKLIRDSGFKKKKPDLKVMPIATKDKIRLLHDKGWPSAKIQKRYRSYTARQIGAVKGWMRRGKY